jgi:hypothetical protein
MSRYRTVEQGEYIASIALSEGFLDWRRVYDHPANAELRRKRPKPNLLLAGDVIFIPDKIEKTEEGATEREHVFQVPSATMEIRLFLHEQQEGQPLANVAYVLIANDTTYKGTTDGEGLVSQKVQIGTPQAILLVPSMKLEWKLQIGHMDPHYEETESEHILTGVQARLANLGYYFGDIDGNLNGATTSAIKQFQRHLLAREDADGTLDDETSQALVDRHKC